MENKNARGYDLLSKMYFYVFCLVIFSAPLYGETGNIEHVAGSLDVEYAGQGFKVHWIEASSVFVDQNRNFYIADATQHKIIKIDRDSVVSRIAGQEWSGYSGDGGPATEAELKEPLDMLQTPQGEIIVADTGNHCIRKIDQNGMIETIAGTGEAGYSGDDDLATDAQLSHPRGLFLDRENHLYISDSGNHRIRKVDAVSGIITTVVGDGFKDENGDGRFLGDGFDAKEASLFFPTDVCLDSIGTMYIADSKNRCIRKVTPDGVITTLYNTLTRHHSSTRRELLLHQGYLYFSDGNLHRLDLHSAQIDTFDRTYTVNDIFLDNRQTLYISKGNVLTRQSFGDVFIDDYRQYQIQQPVQTFYGDQSQGSEAGIYQPRSVWKDKQANIYIADTGNHRIRKISTNGIITTVAGNGTEGFSGDGGDAKRASLSLPYDVCGDSVGNLYIADRGNHRIRKVTPQGIISTVAGDGKTAVVAAGYAILDGPPDMPEDVNDGVLATQAHLRIPMGVFWDESGELYIADTGHHRIRKIDENGIISTVAGKGFGVRQSYGEMGIYVRYLLGGFGGDGGMATEAFLNSPVDMCFDKEQNLYITDTGNHRIRKVDSNTGVITTLAGDGATHRVHTGSFHTPPLEMGEFNGDERSAQFASLNFPLSVAVTELGYIVFADSYNHRIRVILPRAKTLKTIAGLSYHGSGGTLDSYPEIAIWEDYLVDRNEVGGFLGDNGPAEKARLDIPSSIFLDDSGDLYIADTGNHRIRIISNIEQAIVSKFGLAVVEKSDFNNDQKIDFLDFIIFASHYNSQEGDALFDERCDLNNDGSIGFLDFLGFAENFGELF